MDDEKDSPIKVRVIFKIFISSIVEHNNNTAILKQSTTMALAVYLSTFLVAIICALFIKWLLNHNQRLPPGPVGVPVLGYLPFLDVFHLGQSFSKLSKRFGEIFSLRVGTELAIVLNSYESIKKAFSKAELIDRPDTFMFRFFSQGENGIASASGEKWRVQRKFTHTQLKKFGFGRPQMEPFVQDAVRNLISTLKEKSGGGANPVEIGFDINVAVVNVIWSIITGERKSQDDPRIKEFLIAVNKGVELASTSGILLFMPFLAKIFPERLFGIDQMRKWMKASYAYLQEVIDSHKTVEPSAEDPQDFIEAFLAEMAKDGAHPSFNEFQLLVLCSELFGAGGEPTSVTLKWAIRYLAMNPEIQAKAQQEIDNLLGDVDRPVEFADRTSLPYVQALIMDLIRIADIHPIGVLHSPSEDVEMDGFLIPKGSFVFPNFHHVHHDPAYWEKPNELYPEHWLDAEGNFMSKREGFLAFGVGKRKCPGQEVVQMELFTFLSNMLRCFTFKLTPEDNGKIESTAGVVVSPKPYPIILETRNIIV